MPLLINVGLNRKSSRDYQSRGVSINVTAELDPGLLANPPRLQQEIAKLYEQAETALDLQVGRGVSPNGAQPATSSANRGGMPDGQRRTDPPPRSMTQNQFRALQDLARDLGADLNSVSQEVAGQPTHDLDIRQASKLIDVLKARVNRARQAEHATSNGTHSHTSPDDQAQGG